MKGIFFILIPFIYIWERKRNFKRQELEADRFVVDFCKNPKLYIKALENIHFENYMPKNGKTLTHPSLSMRIEEIQKWIKQKNKPLP